MTPGGEGLGRGGGAAQLAAVPGPGVTGTAPRASGLDHCQGTGGLAGAGIAPYTLLLLGRGVLVRGGRVLTGPSVF